MFNNPINKYISLISSKINKDNNREELIILQHKQNIEILKFIKGIKKYNDNIIKKEYSEYNILKREFDESPEQIYKMFKELFDKEYKLNKYFYN